MTRNNSQICMKLAGELRASLEAEAAARGRSLSNLIRQILIAHAAERITQSASAASVQGSANG
jgi:hypothetical protein